MKKKVVWFFKYIGLRPSVAIQFVLSIVLLVYGIVLLTPAYHATSAGLQAFFDLYAMRTVSAIIYTAPGIISLIGLIGKFRRIQQAGWMLLFMGFMYYVILRFLTDAITPITWVFPLALALISAILYLSDKWLE